MAIEDAATDAVMMAVRASLSANKLLTLLSVKIV